VYSNCVINAPFQPPPGARCDLADLSLPCYYSLIQVFMQIPGVRLDRRKLLGKRLSERRSLLIKQGLMGIFDMAP
jgi:hypothetical protein